MSNTVKGTVKHRLKKETGTTNAGKDWQKQYLVITTEGEYPKDVAVMFWGDKADQLADLKGGESVEVSINIESREYNGRWYTDVKAWKMEVLGAGEAVAEAEPVKQEAQADALPF